MLGQGRGRDSVTVGGELYDGICGLGEFLSI